MRAVIFTKNNARIVNNITDVEYYKALENAVIDPDLINVRGIPPHYWKLDNGCVMPMTEAEKLTVDEHHSENDVDNELPVPPEVIEPASTEILVLAPIAVPIIKLSVLQKIINFIKNLFKRG